MPVLTTSNGPRWERRTRGQRLARFLAWIAGTALFMVAFRGIAEETTWAFVLDAGLQARDLADRMMPPDVAWGPALVRPLLDTVHIAMLGTILGVLVALPLAWLAATPTSPAPRVLRPVALLLLVTSRSVNSLIWALLLVVLLGPGLLAGVLAIALRSVGFVGKLVYEAIEETDPQPVEAMITTGATRAQALAWGLVPQVLPTVAGVSVYRWEINIREATVLGLVGAGGIGVVLQASIDALAWSRVGLILLAILSTVVVAEWVSAKVRAGLR